MNLKTIKVILAVVITVTLAYTVNLIYQNRAGLGFYREPTRTPDELVIESWKTYSNTKNNIVFSYPAYFDVKDSFLGTSATFSNENAYDGEISIRAYNINSGDTLDTIQSVTKNGFNLTTTANIKNINGIIVKKIDGYVNLRDEDGTVLKNKKLPTLTILFIKDNKSYDIEWSCSINYACYNDTAVNKLISSIK